jgi:hypothetical protein
VRKILKEVAVAYLKYNPSILMEELNAVRRG